MGIENWNALLAARAMNRKLFTVNNTIRFFFLLFIFSAPHPAAAIPVQHSSSRSSSSSRLQSPVSPQTPLSPLLPFPFHFTFVSSRLVLQATTTTATVETV